MEKVAFNLRNTADFFVARLDDKKLKFLNGEAKAKIERGTKYTLQWFAWGAPGATYKFEITDPKELKFTDEGTLGSSGKAAGICWLELKADA